MHSSFPLKYTKLVMLVLLADMAFLPPATKLWKGNVFTPVCDSVHRGSLCPGGLCPGVPVWGSLCLGGLCQGDRPVQ